ncbi:Meiotic recombination protein SPO11-2 [Linum perenne]
MDEDLDLCRSSMAFFSAQQLCYADILPAHEVRARIEVAVINFLKALTCPDPTISNLALVTRKSSNSRVSKGLLTNVSSIFLSDMLSVRSLMKTNGAKAFVRVWKVMELCYQTLSQEKRVTQRELFYKLLCDSPEYFSSQPQVNRTIQDVVSLLRCSRFSLGIVASSRGVVAGRLVLQARLITTSVGNSQHAIFQRLAEDRIFNHIPSILITAKGYPDMATRFLLHRMSRAFPHLPIFALVDWNPAGLAILSTFKHGSIGMGLEAYRYGFNDKKLPSQDKYKEELELMVQSGKRAEIEALFFHGYDFLGKYIAKKIVQANYI